MTDSESAPVAQRDAELLMKVLWETLTDLMGTAATATLIRRAGKLATVRAPDLAQLCVVKNGLEYSYGLPPSWTSQNAAIGVDALCELTRELRSMLAELTGPVVLRRLDSIPELGACGFPEREKDV